MSSLKRLHQTQRNGKAVPVEENAPASKRLKSSHDARPGSQMLGTLLNASNASRKALTANVTNGLPSKNASRVNENRANVTSNIDSLAKSSPISISSDEDSDDDDVDEEEEEEGQQLAVNGKAQAINGAEDDEVIAEDVEMANGVTDEDEEAGEPSFGDMLKARHPDVINVSLPDPHAEPANVIAAGQNSLYGPVTGHSLATVLQQALKTNDKEMLESCFQLKDVQAVRNTIQRLPSPLVGNLLSRIAERMHKRPGRAGNFMHWIQWSLVAHGGYLATQPDILRRLKSLNQVIKQRAQGLQPLVQLKGKLDMLSAQLELRRGLQSQKLRADAIAQQEGILYIEGQNGDRWDADDDEIAQIEAVPETAAVSSDEEADGFDPAPQDDSADEEESAEDVLDIEAEETDDDEGDDNDSEEEEDSDDDPSDDLDDLDDEDDDLESEEEVKAPRPQTLNRKR